MLLKNRKPILVAVMLLAVCCIPFVITSNYMIRVIINIMIYSIIALSINLIVGFGGQLDFGRSAFAGIGGYFSAVMFTTLHVPFIIAFLGGALFATLVGLMLGMICRYSSFDYLTLITIGFSEMVRLVLLNWAGVTGGTFGFRTGRPVFFGVQLKSLPSMFYFCLILLIICYILIKRIVRSRMGLAFQAIRDDSIAAAYACIDVPKYKMICFAVGSFFTGLAGAMLVHFTTFASPTNYTIDESLIMLQMAILGGLGSLPGSIVGSAILIVMPEVSRAFYEYRLMFMGVLMVLLMLFAPNGLLGRGGVRDQVVAYYNKMRSRRNKQDGNGVQFQNTAKGGGDR